MAVPTRGRTHATPLSPHCTDEAEMLADRFIMARGKVFCSDMLHEVPGAALLSFLLLCVSIRLMSKRHHRAWIIFIIFASSSCTEAAPSGKRPLAIRPGFTSESAVALAAVLVCALLIGIVWRWWSGRRREERIIELSAQPQPVVCECEHEREAAGRYQTACGKARCVPFRTAKPAKQKIGCNRTNKTPHYHCKECLLTLPVGSRGRIACLKNGCEATIPLDAYLNSGDPALVAHATYEAAVYNSRISRIATALGQTPTATTDYTVANYVRDSVLVPSGDHPCGFILKCSLDHKMDCDYITKNTLTFLRISSNWISCPVVNGTRNCPGVIKDEDYRALEILEGPNKLPVV